MISIPVHAGIASRLPLTLNRNKQVKRMKEGETHLHKQTLLHKSGFSAVLSNERLIPLSQKSESSMLFTLISNNKTTDGSNE